MPELVKLSQSSLNRFLDCPARWDYEERGVIGLPTDSQDADFGLAVHDAITTYYNKTSDFPRPVEVETNIRQIFADKVLSEFPTLTKRCESQMQNFIKFELGRLGIWKQYKPTFVERTLSDGFLKGRLDAYWAADQILVDWKTGGSGEISEDMIRQNAIYRALLEFSNYPIKRVFFVMLAYGSQKEAPVTTKAFLEAQVDNMRNGKIVPIRGPHCNWCPFIVRCEFSPMTLWEFA